MLHGACCEGFLSVWQVQPQSVRLRVARANDDDIDPGFSAGVTFNPSGQSEVIGDDWEGERGWVNV